MASLGTKRQRTSQKESPHPLTTDDLPALIQEVYKNLGQRRDEAASSKGNSDEGRAKFTLGKA